MRFIGNKESIVDKIYQTMESRNIRGDSFFDYFAGTASVGKYFKKLGYQVFSSDLLYFSYVLQRAYIVNDQVPDFKKLMKKLQFKSSLLFSSPLMMVVEYLNQISPTKGFVYNNYAPTGTRNLVQPRMYFSDENAGRIDAMRLKIDDWKKNDLISEDVFYILLACLIETVPFYSNTTGVYGAFQKKWDPRSIKKLILRPIEIIINGRKNYAFNENSINLTDKIKADIFYLDPPYNQRQYAPNYHVLETIAKYDNPVVKGITGLRDYKEQKSNFCNPVTGLEELAYIAERAHCKALILSYNSEGIMPQNGIMATLEKFGKLELIEFEYLRYKSNNHGESKKHIREQLYVLKKS